jgi:small subunit ribosomal protein S2
VTEGRSLATEQDFTADKIVQDETPAEEGTMGDYAKYVDPKYAEEIMAESLSLAEEPAPVSPRKGPASETAEPAPEPAVTESAH